MISKIIEYDISFDFEAQHNIFLSNEQWRNIPLNPKEEEKKSAV